MTKTTSSSSEQHLLAQLEEIRNPTAPKKSRAAVEDIRKALFDGDRIVPQYLLDAGFFEVMVNALKREQEGQIPNYYHRIAGILVGCIMAQEDNDTKREEYANKVLDKGGLESTLILMQWFEDDAFMMKSVIGLLFCLSHCQKGQEVYHQMFQAVLFIMDNHDGNEEIYCMSVDFMGALLWGKSLPQEVLKQAVRLLWHGITKFPHEEDVQDRGRALLACLVGEETYQELIELSEYHHCEDADCSPAA